MNLLTQKAGEFSILDAAFVALGKVVTDAVTNPLTNGGGNYLSAGVKVLGAFLASKAAGGRVGGIIATSMMVSAGDDIVSRVLEKRSAVAGRQAQSTAATVGSDSFGLANQGAGIMEFI